MAKSIDVCSTSCIAKGGTSVRSSIIEILVSDRTAEYITREIERVAAGTHYDIEAAPQLLGELGARILTTVFSADQCNAIRSINDASEIVAVVVRNITKLTIPDTPIDGISDGHTIKPHDILLAGLLRLAAFAPTSFQFENGGLIGRNVVPNPMHSDKASSHGSKVPLFWHQDNCGQPFESEELLGCTLPPMPKSLAFFAMRNDEMVPTRVLLVDDVLSRLNASTIATLSMPLFRIGAPASVLAEGCGVEIERAPILSGGSKHKRMRYDPLLVRAEDYAARLAEASLLVALEEATSYAVDISLRGGDMFMFNNYRLLHMRVAFEPLKGPRGRWLRRFYGRSLE